MSTAYTKRWTFAKDPDHCNQEKRDRKNRPLGDPSFFSILPGCRAANEDREVPTDQKVFNKGKHVTGDAPFLQFVEDQGHPAIGEIYGYVLRDQVNMLTFIVRALQHTAQVGKKCAGAGIKVALRVRLRVVMMFWKSAG